MTEYVNSGIPAVGSVRWGAHFCQFYETASDLADTLVPYFKAGIDNNEQCMWVAADPLRADDAVSALRAAVPDLDRRMRRKQVEVINYEEWYKRNDKIGADDVISRWIQCKEDALGRGFNGFRLTGNTYFLEAEDWDSFAEYEAKVNACFCDQRVVALCSYCTDRCRAGDVLDVVQNHEFALARRRGEWALIESSALRQAKAELKKANQELEDRVEQRTVDLQRALDQMRRVADDLQLALADKDVLLQEVHHRVKNNLQVICSLLALKAMRSADTNIREAFEDTMRRITAMSLVHERLYECDDIDSIDFAGYLGSLGNAMLSSFGADRRIELHVLSDEAQVDLHTAVPLGLIAAEAITNSLKHGFPGDRRGRITLSFRPASDVSKGELAVADNGVGIVNRDDAAKNGLGMALMHNIARQVGGQLTTTTGEQTVVRLSFSG